VTYHEWTANWRLLAHQLFRGERYVGDSDIRCERLAVGNVFGVAVQGFSISTTVVSTDSPRVCANPLVPW
jgi:hypothetical protein